MSIVELSAIASVPLVLWFLFCLINWFAARELKRSHAESFAGIHVTAAGFVWAFAMIGTWVAVLGLVMFEPTSWLGRFIHDNGLIAPLLILQVPFLLLQRWLRRRGIVLFTRGSGA